MDGRNMQSNNGALMHSQKGSCMHPCDRKFDKKVFLVFLEKSIRVFLSYIRIIESRSFESWKSWRCMMFI